MNDQSAMALLKDDDRGSPKAPTRPGDPVRLGVFWSRNDESQRLAHASYSEPPDFPVEYMFSQASTFERREKSRRKQVDCLEANMQESLEYLADVADHKHQNERTRAITRVDSSSKDCNMSYTTVDVLETFFGRSVMERFADQPRLCVGITKKSVACTKRIAKDKREKAEAILQRLSELRLPSQVEAYTTELKSISDLIFCHLHRSQAPEQLHSKRGQLLESPNYSSKSDASLPHLPVEGQRNEDRTLTKVPLPQYTQIFYRYIQVLSPFKLSLTAKLTFRKNLEDVIRKPLTKRELKTGSIYVYWFQPNFGNRKIGWTTKDVQVRMRCWEHKCKHHVELVHPDPRSKQTYVPHAERLEKIIHAELHAYRRLEKNCKGCGRSHKEWFIATDEHIKQVIQKWTVWMEKMPYEEVVPFDAVKSNSGLDKNSVPLWTLKEEYIRMLPDLCKPLLPSHPVSESSIKPASPKGVRQAPRRSSRIAAKRAALPRGKDL